MAILDAAIKIEKESQGAFDITVATVTELWDFKNEGVVPEADKISAALKFVGGEKLIFDKENMTETQAHHYLEKEAMNRCIPKVVMAQEIIKKYG